MEQILLTYLLRMVFPKESLTTIIMLYKNTKVMVRSFDGDADFFNIVAGILQGDTLAPYLFRFCLDYGIQPSIDLKENDFTLKKGKKQMI